MGQTRTKKPKKASKDAGDASSTSSPKFKSLSITDNLASTSHMKTNSSQQSSTQNDHDNAGEDEHDCFVPDPTYIEVRNTEDRGKAVFAARKIPAGTLILAETPLIRLTQAEEDADKSTSSTTEAPEDEKDSALSRQFSSLAKSIQKSYLTLFDSNKSGFSQIRSIYYSNCYNLSGLNKPSKTSPGGSCIGVLASRMNHSCVPNAQFSYDEARNLMLFHTIKPIPRDREVLSNYDSVYEVKAQRQRRQMMYYGFRCDCEACEPGLNEFWVRSDERRKAMIEARREIKMCEEFFEQNGKTETGMDPVGALQRLEGLLIKESLAGLPLANVYRSLSKWTDRLGDTKGTRKWRMREIEVCSTCLGKGPVRVKEIKAKLDLSD